MLSVIYKSHALITPEPSAVNATGQEDVVKLYNAHDLLNCAIPSTVIAPVVMKLPLHISMLSLAVCGLKTVPALSQRFSTATESSTYFLVAIS